MKVSKYRLWLVVAAVVVPCAMFAQDLPLSEARAKIGDSISDPAVMATTVKGLSAADQLTYLADVNAAIAQMPGSAETRAAAFLDANRAALKSAAKGNLTSLLAQVFATVPLKALTVLNERLASDLFNRAANPSVTYTDAQYTNLVTKTLKDIAKRMSDVDKGDVRTAFAILMFTRASNGSPANLSDSLADVMDESSREVARKEWFPAALAEGDTKSYDSMLSDGDYGTLPNERVVSRLAAPQSVETMLTDLADGQEASGRSAGSLSAAPYGTDRGGVGSALDTGLHRTAFEEPRGYPGQN